MTVLSESELESKIAGEGDESDEENTGEIFADEGPQQMSLGDY